MGTTGRAKAIKLVSEQGGSESWVVLGLKLEWGECHLEKEGYESPYFESRTLDTVWRISYRGQGWEQVTG